MVVKASCWGGTGNSSRVVETDFLCPVCKGKCKEVKGITVKHLVFDELKDRVLGVSYRICLNHNCNVVYCNTENYTIFTKENIRVPIWFKQDADPKYICYCNKVTEQEIIDAVINKGAKDMKDIIRLTGAMKNARCEVNNPLGKCCGSVIQETIDKALSIK